MKNIIIGTAGHIDHGKTTLIKALTGHETDRLKEEQKRGISIDLGFTYFDLPSGTRAGIIDVPGHEKFIKNMLAGVAGMDVVILMVAADEGMMPQTIEHLEILNLLGIKNGLIAISKIDMVDEEWLELIIEDTKDRVKGTFLEGAPIVKVSSITGEGIDEIKETIDHIVADISEQDPEHDLPRLPVDRSFTISGHGTVVTGTLISGVLKVDDEIQIFPSDIKTRIRSLQVHDSDVKEAYRGQRVAVNLASVKKEEAPRGSMLAPPASMKPTRILDLKLKTIDLPFDLTNRTRMRLYLGTQEVFGRLILLEKDILSSREETFAQILLESPVVARKGDRFIVRLFSPMITLGGGEVVDANPSRKKRFNEDDIELVRLMGQGDSKDITEALIGEHSKDFPSIKDIAKYESRPVEKVEVEVEALEEEGRAHVIKMNKDSYVIHDKYLKELVERLEKEIGSYHETYPLRLGINKEEIRSKYFKPANKRVGELFLDVVINNSSLEEKDNHIKDENFNITYTDQEEKILEGILGEFDKEFLSSPDVVENLSSQFKKDKIEEVLRSLVQSGEIISVGELLIRKKDFDKALIMLKKYLADHDFIDLAQARDLWETNRKTALGILEELDRRSITIRSGEGRKLV